MLSRVQISDAPKVRVARIEDWVPRLGVGWEGKLGEVKLGSGGASEYEGTAGEVRSSCLALALTLTVPQVRTGP